MDSLCHPWFTTTNVSYRFPILKLPPPPCAVLLVYINIYSLLATRDTPTCWWSILFFCESTWGSFPFSLVNPSNYIQKFIPDFHHCHIFSQCQGKEIQFKMCLRPTVTSESRGGASFRKVRKDLWDLCMSERGLTRLRFSYGSWWTGYFQNFCDLCGAVFQEMCLSLPGERKRHCWPEMFEWGVVWRGTGISE